METRPSSKTGKLLDSNPVEPAKEIEFLKNFIQNINEFNILEKGYGESHGGAFFAYFIRNFYREIEKDLDVISFDIDKISKDKKVVIYCRSGKRSAAVIQALESQHGFTNLFNLKGGILTYIEEVGI